MRISGWLVFGVVFVAACSSKESSSPPASAGSSGGPNANGNPSSNAGTPKDGTITTGFPLVTPPVRAAAPQGFGGDGHGMTTHGLKLTDLPLDGGASTLDPSDIRNRFFSAGPTNIYSILGAIDDRIAGLNTRISTSPPACLAQEPVSYTIHPFGHDITFYAQCYESLGSSMPGDPGLVQYGKKDGATYYYSAIGAAWTAAVLTPANVEVDGGGADGGEVDAGEIDAGDAGALVGGYHVHAWSGVGYLNAAGCGDRSAWDDCSYGVIEILADSNAHTFEMSVAGVGFGYCGAQLKSDGSLVYGIGSTDMGSMCNAPQSLCVAASDVSTPSTCNADLTTFLLPALGRASSVGPHAGGPGVDAGPGAAWAPSAYPGGSADSITLDGTSSDSLHFGPTAPVAGATKI